jgi:magnesium chelatase family protein
MNTDLFGNTLKQGDFADIKGLYHVKRALEIAVVGRHNVLLIGGHGSGKTFIKERINTITDTPIQVYESLPCPCGNFTNPKIECNCSTSQIQKHLGRIGSDILDSVDIHVELPILDLTRLPNERRQCDSAYIKSKLSQLKQNKRPTENDISKDANELLKMAILEIGISARAYDKIIKVAITIAQMDNSKTIEAHHISEAIGYRSLDRNLWA